MREAEKKEFDDQKVVDDFLKREAKKEHTVEQLLEADGKQAIRISDGDKIVVRKEHTLPEFARELGG